MIFPQDVPAEGVLDNPARRLTAKELREKFYRDALVGRAPGPRGKLPGEFPGLRAYAKGFTAAEGFDLHRIAEWTPAQKAKVTRYFKEVHELTARPFQVVRLRNKAHLQMAQTVAKHAQGFPQIKVAFVPVASDQPVRVRFTKDSMVVEAKYWDKRELLFDQERLALEGGDEVDRLTKSAPKNTVFTIQAGKYEIPNTGDARTIRKRVVALMNKYDGKKPLPKTSGNRGDKPEKHHWSIWLAGLTAYNFKNRGNPQRLLKDMERAKTALRAQRAAIQRRGRNRKNKDGMDDGYEYD